jgi:hypothetical protein
VLPQLGGNSLGAAAIVSSVRSALGQRVEVGWLYESETIRGACTWNLALVLACIGTLLACDVLTPSCQHLQHSKWQRMVCVGFAARLFGEAAEDDSPDHASEQLLAVAASITKAGDKLHPLSFQQVSRLQLHSGWQCSLTLQHACSRDSRSRCMRPTLLCVGAGAILQAVAERPAVACQQCGLQRCHCRQPGSCCT